MELCNTLRPLPTSRSVESEGLFLHHNDWQVQPVTFSRALFTRASFTRAYRLTFALSLFCLIIGGALGYEIQQEEPKLVDPLLEQLQGLTEKINKLPWFFQALIIFLNNLRVSILMFLLGGIIPFIPLLIIFSNGMLIGIMAAYLGVNQTMTTATFLLGLLPHGVFEIPAILLSSAVGIVWGARNWLKWLDIRESPGFLQNMKNGLSLLPVIILLLLIAALIEVLISPYLLSALI